ncbi:hypothetical protein [Chryseobacterium sp. HMWF035]|uniref:hypothetical protein n=1 Tax=Chryseobacterium sp. HMWF035 TaxID=2056868 RepID=UPI000D58875A|nr:hypothetical protein [Chryseobacterium sp. HMWF035]PVV61258.1 hypothetical protein DD829_02665 [Chryseobacterium sp. HMWF035]
MKKMIQISLFLSCSTVYFSQVGINTNTPEATLDIRAKNHNGTVTANDGILVPRVNNLASAGSINGQLVYLTANNGSFTKGFHYWDGSIWVPISGDSSKDSWIDGVGNTNSSNNIVIGSNSGSDYAKLDIQSTNKGILLPRMNLTSATMDLNADGDNNIANQPVGLIVFNTGTTIRSGFYFWNGTEWRTLDNSTAEAPIITNILCDAAVLTPSTYTSGVAYSGTLLVPYENGNGGTYAGGTSVVANGITFTLQGNKLEYGSGNLVFKAVGTPSSSSPVMTNILMNNSLIPFMPSSYSCTVKVGESSVENKVSAVMGPLAYYGNYIIDNTGFTPGAVNDKVYEKIVTSPDGKFSVRLGTVEGYALQYADLTIRNNTGTNQTIIWNFGDNFITNGYLSYASNASVIPGDGKWYGNNNGSPATPESSAFYAIPSSGSTVTSLTSYYGWADQDVYNGAPEFRRYTWTTSNTSDQTIYNLEFMMGAPNPTALANDANCAQTKVYLKIEQIKAN